MKDTAAGKGTRRASWMRGLRDKSHAIHPAAFKPVPGPRAAVVLRDIERLLMHAGVNAAGLSGIENDAPDGGRREPGVPVLPCPAAVFRDSYADAPARHCDPARRGGIEGDVGDVLSYRQISVALESHPAIGGQ